MGSLFSYCCGPRKRSPEQEPLLPKHNRPEPLPVLPTQRTANRLAAVLAALHNDKLPTQQQLDLLTGSLLSSSLFADVNRKAGVLSDRGRVVLMDVGTLLEALRELGDERNGDNAVQDIIDDLRHLDASSISVQPSGLIDGPSLENVGQLPSPQDDARKLAQCIKTLALLLFTSSAFRLLLTDIITTSREILADLFSQVGSVAQVIESGATIVEGVVRPSEEEKQASHLDEEDPEEIEEIQKKQAAIKVDAEQEILETVNESTRLGQEALKSVREESQDRIRAALLQRIKYIVSQAQADPRFAEALETMVVLGEKYLQLTLQVSDATVNETSFDADVDIQVDDRLRHALARMKDLSKAFLGDRVDGMLHDWNQVLQSLRQVEQGSQEGHGFLGITDRFRAWLASSLKDREFPASTASEDQLSALYNDASRLLNGRAPEEQQLKHDVLDAVQNVQTAVDTLSQDVTLKQVLQATMKFTADSAYFVAIIKPELASMGVRQAQQARRAIMDELRRDFVAFILPRVLAAIKVIPLPRVELKSPTMDAVLDNLNLSSLSFIPDNITITNWNEIHIIASDEARLSSSSSLVQEVHTRSRVHINGLRVSVDDLAYYANVRGPSFLGYMDSGLLSLDIGTKGNPNEGLLLDIEIEADESGSFKVVDVKVDVPGLNFTIQKSRHWIINSVVLQPLLGPVVRQGVKWIAAQQVRILLEDVAAKLSHAAREASGEETWVDWIWAILKSYESPEEEETEDEDQLNMEPQVVTSTSVTTKGVIHTSHTPATLPEEDTVIAIGIGEQVIHDAPLPARDPEPAVDTQRSALDQLQEGVDNVEHRVEDARVLVTETQAQARDEILEAGDRWRARDLIERRRRGWRSDAFNI